MNSKERVRMALLHQKPDKVPAAFEAVAPVVKKLLNHYGFTNMEQLYQKFDIDLRPAYMQFKGRELSIEYDEQGRRVVENFWGFKRTEYPTEHGICTMLSHAPLQGFETIDEIRKNYKFPDPDEFDYSPIADACERYPDKAIIIGHEGAYMNAANLVGMEEFYMMMIEDPDMTQYILDKMVEFELGYYKRAFEAGKGKVDMLRPHDDYGTQLSMICSVPMWRDYFKENTKKLVDLAHSYDAFFMQHSCGAIEPLISELIDCKVDALEPVQKVPGLEIEHLKEKFDSQITFHGGVDTQWLLPHGTPEEIIENAEYIMRILGENGSYILMASQSFETDVPLENIEAVYKANRYL